MMEGAEEMESANSGSLAQSSSDGDEEYESPHSGAVAESSRQHPFPRDPHVIPFSMTVTTPQPPPPPPPYYDPLAAYSTLLTSDAAWCPRSDPNPLTGNTTQPPPPPPPPGKNPKKRTRASRRAPTTVLTTDTTNFRAMVQEFTGIPASPFTASSSTSAARARLDQLFGSNRTFLPEQLPPQQQNHHHQHGLPLNLQRLMNHQIQLPATTAPAPTTTGTTTTSNADVINFQLPLSDLGLISNNLPVTIGNNHQLLSSGGPLSWPDDGLGLGSSSRSAINGGNCNVNSTSSGRCEGMLESWICSTDH